MKVDVTTMPQEARPNGRGIVQKLIIGGPCTRIMITMRAWAIVMLILIVLLSSMPLIKINPVRSAATIFVPADFGTIQEAINNAAEGDTIFVYNGTYVENVVVNKTISLIGEDNSLSFIDGGSVGAAITVTAHNVTISGFTVGNGSLVSETGAGILLTQVQYANLSDNIIASSYTGLTFINSSFNNAENNQFSSCNISISLNFSDSNTLSKNFIANSIAVGFGVYGSSFNIIEGNNVSSSGGFGISLKSSPLNKILGNRIAGCQNGLSLENSGENTLASNDIKLNQYNFHVVGTNLAEFMQDANTTNKIDGKSLYYLVNKNGFSIDGSLAQDVGYLGIVNSSNVQAANLILSNNDEGFLCAYSSSCLIRNSSIANNSRAGLVHYSPDFSIINSTFSNNVEGVSFISSASSIVRNSSFKNSSGVGLRFASSGGSVVEDNLIVFNTGGGINLYSSPNCNASRNNLVGNSLGILVQVSSRVRIVDNSVINSTGDGIYFSSSDNCVAQGNNVSYNSGYAIIFQIAQNSTVTNNRVWNSTRVGIFMYNCNSSLVTFNFAEYTEAGISLQSSPNAQINNNELSRNAHEGIRLADSGSGIVSNNNVVGNYWDGIALQSSPSCTLDKNSVSNNLHFGIWIQSSPVVKTLNCNATSNIWDGVYISGSDGSRVVNSDLTANGDAGCRIYSCNNVTLSQNRMTLNDEGVRIFLADNNTVSDNGIEENIVYGINIYNSTGNKIYHNNLNNTLNVNILNVSNTKWDDGYPSGGNYWSNYNGSDVQWGPNQDLPGSDGIGDTSRIINSENSDRYPIMMPSRYHDVSIENVTLPLNEIYTGWVFGVNVTVKNNGGYVETMNVTANYNGTYLQTRVIYNLTVGDSSGAVLSWNTSGLAPYSLYEVKAEVSVITGETNVDDNIFDFGIVRIKMVGDVNNDRKVNILDIAAVATGFGSKYGESRYKLNYDMNLDYLINIIDISMAARNYGKSF